VNHALGITWEIPKGWQVQKEGASQLGEGYLPLLRLLPNGAQSVELVEFDCSSEGNTASPNSSLERQGWEPSGHARYYTLGGGIPTHGTDFESKNDPRQYLALLAGQRHGVDVSVLCVADSAPRIEELLKVVLRIRVQPDWGTPEEPFSATAPGSPPRQVRVSQGVSQSVLLQATKVQPMYPEAARKAHIQGLVVMNAHITTEGRIRNLFVVSGPPSLTQAAIDAVSQWRYKPYLLNGSPVEIETQITVNFTLR